MLVPKRAFPDWVKNNNYVIDINAIVYLCFNIYDDIMMREGEKATGTWHFY